jgi:hypothetical protein
MGLLEKNSILASIHGSVGNLTVVHQKGRVWTRNKPTVKPKATPRRKAHRGKLGRASKWASILPKQAPEVAAKYSKAAEGTDWSWQNMAIADYMHGPVIEEIDLSGYSGLSGERIRVQARDDVKPPMKLGVAEVRVVIRNLAGKVLEQGKAVQDGAAWAYVTQTEVEPGQIVNIEVMATDQPSNHAIKTVPHLTRTQA